METATMYTNQTGERVVQEKST